MRETIGSRFKKAWNVFLNRDPTGGYRNIGAGYSYRPDRVRPTGGNERTFVTSIFSRIASDVSSVDIRHVRIDDNGRFLREIKSGLNNCLSVEANIDQTGRAFIYDAVFSMLDEGVVALVPTETDKNMYKTDSYDILSMRTGKIVNWYPSDVEVRLYDERTGQKENLVLPKSKVSILENPLYTVFNEPNSYMKRLTRKLALLDAIDEQSGSGKLDLIIQLPYIVKTEARKQQAEQRRKDIETQLSGSKFGIAYTDSTERVTQLNRPIENNLMKQIEYLTSMLFSQLGMSQGVLDGTADEKTMLNYENRIVALMLTTLVEEMKRKFLTKTARSQLQSILFFKNPFKLVPVTELATIADTFTRNEIMTSNEFRQIIGMKPSDDPKADELRNKNLSAPTEETDATEVPDETDELQNEWEGEIQNEDEYV